MIFGGVSYTGARVGTEGWCDQLMPSVKLECPECSASLPPTKIPTAGSDSGSGRGYSDSGSDSRSGRDYSDSGSDSDSGRGYSDSGSGSGTTLPPIKISTTSACSQLGLACSLRGLACSLRGLACSLRGLARSLRGLACSLRGLACSLRGLASSLRGLACSLPGLGNFHRWKCARNPSIFRFFS